MGIDVRRFPDIGLVYVRYSGVVRLDETMTAFSDFMRDPRAAHFRKHLVDLQDMTAAAFDFPALMRVQAKKAEHFLRGGGETLLAYYAPSRDMLRVAHLAQRSWDGLGGTVARTFTEESQAVTFLGLPSDISLASLRSGAD